MPLKEQLSKIVEVVKLTEEAAHTVSEDIRLGPLADAIVDCPDLLNQVKELLVGEAPIPSSSPVSNADELSHVVFKKFTAAPGYEQLVQVFAAAHDQAAYGKGKERHANGLPFHEQRMQGISDLVGSPDGMVYQLVKKTTEGLQFDSPEKREHELLGALNYLAGIVIWLRRHEAAKPAEG